MRLVVKETVPSRTQTADVVVYVSRRQSKYTRMTVDTPSPRWHNYNPLEPLFFFPSSSFRLRLDLCAAHD